MKYPDWPGKLTRAQAIQLLERITDQDDPYWSNIVDAHYDEKTDTMPSIYHLFQALGITEAEYRDAMGYGDSVNVNWPELYETKPATYPCSECKEPVPSDENTCPHCGFFHVPF